MNEMANDGRHSLLMASQEGHVSVVATLIEYSANVNCRAHDGKTAFRASALEGHKDITHMLMCNGADCNYKDPDGRSTLYVLALENQVVMATFLLDSEVDVECIDIEGRTALHVAAWQGHLNMVELLLNHKANVNAVDNDRRTTLQSAAWQGNDKVVRLLLEHKAEVDHTCNQGATALCIAAQEGHEEVVRVLLQYNANPNHADQFGRTAIRVALKSGHLNVCKILEDYGATPVNGVNKSRSTSSSSSTENRPALTCTGPSTSAVTGQQNGRLATSPCDSPDSTFDRRKSYHSNNSSSKSSSNLTSTSSTNQSVGNNIQPQPEVPPDCLTFTQQLQQCSMARHRSRPVSRVLSPVSEPQSPVQSPPGTPITDGQTNKVDLKSPDKNINLLGSSPVKYHGVKKDKIAATINIISNPNPELLTLHEEPVWQINPHFQKSSLSTKVDLHKKSSVPDPPASVIVGKTALELRSPEARRKRNGIVTNPNFTKSPGINGNPPKFPFGDNTLEKVPLINGNIHSQSMPRYKGPPRPNGLPLKKETPL